MTLVIAGFANAQKGTVLVGGNIGYDTSKHENAAMQVTQNLFGIYPKVGYQFHDNWSVGVALGFSSSRAESGTNSFLNAYSLEKEKRFSGGVFARYTKPLSETFSVFADLDLGMQNAKFDRTTRDFEGSSSTSIKGNGVYVGITPALFINFKKGFGLNFSIGGLGYEPLNAEGNADDYSHFFFNFGQNFNIGVSKNF